MIYKKPSKFNAMTRDSWRQDTITKDINRHLNTHLNEHNICIKSEGRNTLRKIPAIVSCFIIVLTLAAVMTGCAKNNDKAALQTESIINQTEESIISEGQQEGKKNRTQNSEADSGTETYSSSDGSSEIKAGETSTYGEEMTDISDTKKESGTASDTTLVNSDNPESVNPVHLDITTVSEGAQDASNLPVYSFKYVQIELSENDKEKFPVLESSLKENSFLGDDTIEKRRTALQVQAEELAKTRSEITESENTETGNTENDEDQYITDNETIEISDETTAYPVRADNRIVSIETVNYSYLGGAHGGLFINGYNYDTETGRLMNISDIVRDTDRFYDEVKILLRKNYSEDTFFGLDESIESYKKGEYTPSFILGNTGMNIVFNQYEIAPYANGIQTVNMPYEEYPEIFNETVCAKHTDYTEVLPLGTNVKANGEILCTDGIYGENGVYEKIKITYAGNTIETPCYSYGLKPLYIMNEGNSYVYMFEKGDDDEEYIDVFTLKKDGPEYTGKADLFEYSSSEAVNTGKYKDFSTWSRKNKTRAVTDPKSFYLKKGKTGDDVRGFRVGPDGMPEEKK